ncbi:MAG: tetratricopeptide repeat protein [Thermomicrobiales bacterium]
MAQKQMTKRQLGEVARRAAFDGNWEDAVELNLRIVAQSEKDPEAFNRLGRAYISLGQLDDAKEAYTKALRADAANLIARRNLQRLETLLGPGGNAAEVTRPGPMSRTSIFLEEVGRTWVDELVNPNEAILLADITPGEQLVLSEEDNRLVVRRASGARVGEIEPKTGQRVIDLIGRGNRYEIYALGMTGQTLRFILREIHRDPANSTTVSFPRQITSRAYLRDRDLLRQRDESEFFLFDEDEDEDETETITADAEEDDTDIAESDNEGFGDVAAPEEDDESTI